MNIQLIVTKEDIQEEIKDIEKNILKSEEEITVLKNKIKFMEENKLDKYDEDAFKAYHVLSLLDDEKLSKMEKSKLIAKLIKE